MSFKKWWKMIIRLIAVPYWARSKTRKPRKSQKSRQYFSEIFKSEFLILAVEQNRKLGNKKTWNNFSENSDFSDFFEFSICHFLKNFFFSILKYRNSRSQMFFKTGAHKNFAMFNGKHLCWSVFFNKVASFIKKENLQFYLKRDFNTGAFLRILRSF